MREIQRTSQSSKPSEKFRAKLNPILKQKANPGVGKTREQTRVQNPKAKPWAKGKFKSRAKQKDKPCAEPRAKPTRKKLEL